MRDMARLFPCEGANWDASAHHTRRRGAPGVDTPRPSCLALAASRSKTVVPRTTVRRQRGSSSPGSSGGRPVAGSSSSASQTANVAGAPARQHPVGVPAGGPPAAPGVRLERGGRVEARAGGPVPDRGADAAPRVERRDRRVRAEGQRRCPLAAIAANGLSDRARGRPSRSAYMPDSPPQSRSKAGCTDATTPEPGEDRQVLRREHLDVLDAVPGGPQPVGAEPLAPPRR